MGDRHPTGKDSNFSSTVHWVGEIARASSCLESRSKDEVDGQEGREQTLRGEEEEEGKEEEEGEAREQATQREADERQERVYTNACRSFFPEG